jgi:salicylate hydroxylase
VVSSHLTLPEVISIYEKSRIPKSHFKQRISFLNGYIWHLPEGQAARNRGKATEVELSGEQPMRSPNLYADPATVLDVYRYDARARADEAVKFFLGQRVLVDDSIDVARRLTRS